MLSVFTRDELCDIRDRAEELSKQTSIHPAWSRAYLALAEQRTD